MMTAVSIKAPAKINLFLHITGKRADGYHLLDSLVVFANEVADEITVTSSEKFSFTMSGPFSKHLEEEGHDKNLVTKAASLFSKETGQPDNISIHLKKNIPLGTGLGGGSADAAATVKALEKFHATEFPKKSLISLGADVPVCYASYSCRLGGIGENILPVPKLPLFHALLIWPAQHSSTIEVFEKYSKSFRPSALKFPATFGTLQQFIGFLESTDNDLAYAAETLYPGIRKARKFLEGTEGCLLARMSGSGSCVFGIFDSPILCREAGQQAKDENPSWWIRTIMVE